MLARKITVKNLSRIVLKLVLLGIPMVIAACYGMPLYMKNGRVVDADTKEGLDDIKIKCVGGVKFKGSDISSGDGRWSVDCDGTSLELEDTKEPKRYQKKTISSDDGRGNSIEMNKVE